MSEDKIFADDKEKINDFEFGEETAQVFDDMLDRSVPLYRELQRMIGEIANEFAQSDTNIVDLGCSTGITLLTLNKMVEKNVKLIGVDYSQAMLDKCKKNLIKGHVKKEYEFLCRDLNNGLVIKNASVVVLNLTLQFIRPLQRDLLIQHIYNGLVDNGCLILVEKVLGNDSVFNRTFIQFYYDMKQRNGYSELEIAQKREALENVLIPYRMSENDQMLHRNGFRYMDIFYKWYNFYGVIAMKM
ncbi:MAG: carboxy-S-adenosyl-L-methionine synthase CmoA [Candidatus Omnitrophica bacterium]|nr:carboxy-S-adenosyl-L-methionine synthase CmoA [Candidatus Omnitrophota bacterium]